MKPMMMIMRYWINACSAPIFILPDSMRCPPNHMMAMLKMLVMNHMIGPRAPMRKPTGSRTPLVSVFAFSKRCDSVLSRTKARTTRTPVTCSRITRLMASSLACSRLNSGPILEKMMPVTSSTIGRMTAMDQVSSPFCWMAMTRPPTNMIGACSTNRNAWNVAFCTW